MIARPMPRIFQATAVAVVVALGLATSSATAAAPYQAAFVAQCCSSQVLEAGQTADEYFVLQNTGTTTWTPSTVFLGTDGPRDRGSVFAASSWLTGGRPTALLQPQVAPGQSGRFAFEVTAPGVGSASNYTESFGALAEGVTWMDGAAGLGPDLAMNWAVLPAADPTAAFRLAPPAVTADANYSVVVDGNDNVDVESILVTIDPAGPSPRRVALVPPSPDTSDPQFFTSFTSTATFGTAGLAPGIHDLAAVVTDGIGRTGEVDTTFVVVPRPLPRITTGTPTAIGPTWAAISGTVDPNGYLTQAHFEYGPTASHGQISSLVNVFPGNGTVTVAPPIAGLKPATTYHIALVGFNVGGQTNGNDVVFTTLPAPGTPTPTPTPPAPAPRLVPTHAFKVAAGVLRHRVVMFVVRGAARGAHVRVTCTSGCGKANRALGTGTARSATLRVPSARKPAVGARLTVTVAQAGRATRYRAYRVLSRSPYLGLVSAGCLAGATHTTC
jgi:hypothetical protein